MPDGIVSSSFLGWRQKTLQKWKSNNVYDSFFVGVPVGEKTGLLTIMPGLGMRNRKMYGHRAQPLELPRPACRGFAILGSGASAPVRVEGWLLSGEPSKLRQFLIA
ncbi:hypothetical protein OKW50_008203 [Paraburkholderia youngii]